MNRRHYFITLKRWVAAGLGGLLFVAVLAILPFSARSQCAQWDLGGILTIQQEETSVRFEIGQNGSLFVGRASYFVDKGGDLIERKGDVDGSIKGTVFTAKVYWDGNHTVGVYNGTISPTGRIEGDVYGQEKPNIKVRWYSINRIGCATTEAGKKRQPFGLPAAATAPPVAKPAKTIKSTGHPKMPAQPSGAPQEVATASASATAPMIRANSNNVVVRPPNTAAKITLTWDGGQDHPYAEVWVKVDDAAETLVIEQGKGSRLMKVEKGKTYTYILTDSGTTLATVTVTVQ